jgi:hypothetical protein
VFRSAVSRLVEAEAGFGRVVAALQLLTPPIDLEALIGTLAGHPRFHLTGLMPVTGLNPLTTLWRVLWLPAHRAVPHAVP